MAIEFREATREKLPAKIAIFGPSGSGKTLTALRIARGLVGPEGRIVLIDTENDRARLYSGRDKWGPKIKFVHGTLADPTIENMIDAIDSARPIADVIIIDSISHTWQELVAESNRMTSSGYRGGNSYTNWAKLTPKQTNLIKRILWLDKHLICTMRAKSEYILEEVEERGRKKTVPRYVGLEPIQGKNIEFEFDQLFALDMDHCLQVLKDRTGVTQDRVITCPGEDLGDELRQWLDGEDAKQDDAVASAEYKRKVEQDIKSTSIREKMYEELLECGADLDACTEFAITRCKFLKPGQTMDDLSEAHMKEIIARTETFAQKAADYYEEMLNNV